MPDRLLRYIILFGLSALPGAAFAAVDSYRFFHVTIETPYMIFLFLVGFILAPFFLMAILYWRYAGRRATEGDDGRQEDQE